MPSDEFEIEVMDVVQRLASESSTGEVDGHDVADALGLSHEDTDLYNMLFINLPRRGKVEIIQTRGGMGLPERIAVAF